MNTSVLMKRELFGDEINQDSKTEFFSATDLVRAGNKWRVINNLPIFNLNVWFESKSTKEFKESLEKNFGTVKINSKGKNQHTWVHPFLFIDIALAINPELKIEVYSWIYDSLIRYRNDSGDSHKMMTGSIFNNINNKSEIKNCLIKTANKIRIACGIEKESDWQHATEQQLKKRDEIHKTISRFCDIIPDVNEAVRLSIIAVEKEFNKQIEV